MKNLIPILSLLLFMNCEGKQNPPKTSQNQSAEVGNFPSEIKKIDSVKAKEILIKPAVRYKTSLQGYDFNLAFNYRMRFIPSEKNPGSYYKFQWKVNDNFTIDSDSPDFKRFSVYNFIPYLPGGADEGDFFIAKSKSLNLLNISDFLETADDVFYRDENSAIFKYQGSVKALYFEYLPKTQEYLVYLSDTFFQNKRPEPNQDEQMNQLLHQIRMAKNILKPIGNQDKSWSSYENQLSVLEKDFFKNINSETQKALASDADLKSYEPADQGNSSYYEVFKITPEIENIWKKANNGALSLTEKEKKDWSQTDFRIFFNSDYKQVTKTNLSFVYKRNSEDSFCLITKTKNKKFIIFKYFSALYEMTPDYYDSEIEFYREFFENYN